MKTLLLVAFVAVSAVPLVAATGCDGCPLCHHGGPSSSAAVLAPTDAIHPMFTGCQSACGSKSHEDLAKARVQPVALGEVTFCPVSGAVFRATAQSTQRVVNGKTLYFCCEACAGWFDQNQPEVLARRGLG
jgi:YHS domain-containing protein